MAKIKNFSQTFEVQSTAPLDDRLVVDSIEDLYRIEYPYTGMSVTVAGSSDLWIFIGAPGEQSDSTKWKKVSGSGSEYSLPLMTPDMVSKALADPNSGFTEDTDYVSIDDGGSIDGETETNYVTAANGTYLEIMFTALRQLQAEVTKLKNTFKYGINSYTETDTALSAVSGIEYENEEDDEPLWALDPDMLSELSEITRITEDKLARFTKSSQNNVLWVDENKQEKIKITGDSIFSLTNDEEKYIRANEDAKIILFASLSKIEVDGRLQDIGMGVDISEVSDNSGDDDFTIDIFDYLGDTKSVGSYNIMMVISRERTLKEGNTETKAGSNSIYFTVSDAVTDEVLKRGYYDIVNDEFTNYENKLDKKYTWTKIRFKNCVINKCRFCSKYLNFSNDVVPSIPDDRDDFKYEAAHITIRSVKDIETAKKLINQLQENELVWIKDTGTLRIKSDGTLRAISSGAGNNEDIKNEEDIMKPKELLEKLLKMGIIVNTKGVVGDDDEDFEVNNIDFNDVASITFVNQDANKKYKFEVDAYGELKSQECGEESWDSIIESYNKKMQDANHSEYKVVLDPKTTYAANRGFISNVFKGEKDINATSDFGNNSDRLRISSLFVPLTSAKKCGCSHSFIELENSSTRDLSLKGMNLYHRYYDGKATEWKVRKLPLTGIVRAGSTYLIRGAQEVDIDAPSTFIKVRNFDQEWYDNGKLVSFKLDNDITAANKGKENLGKFSHAFMITYGDIKSIDDSIKNGNDIGFGTVLIKDSKGEPTTTNTTDDATTYPYVITNPRYVEGIVYTASYMTSSDNSVSNDILKPEGKNAPLFSSSTKNWAGFAPTIISFTDNSMYRIMFKLDPAKQAFNGFNEKDSSRERGKATDIFIVNLDNDNISFKTSDEIYPIERYTPHASFEKATVMTDKTKLNFDRPNMVNVGFGIDVYNTRTFNWISVGTFDEYVWFREQGTETWSRFESYNDNTTATADDVYPRIKTFNKTLFDAAYNRIVSKFPGDNTSFTSHKCIIQFVEDGVTTPTTYEYRVGRATGYGNTQLDDAHCSPIRTFTLYPRTWEGRVYQITDQQGFHWIEYQVWAGVAKALNDRIAKDLAGKNEFPIIINTGDMTQSGARINEWLDYHNAGEPLFNHLEQMNVVGNNDLNDVDSSILGTGNDSGKSVSRFFHYFYCHEVPNDTSLVMGPDKKFIPSIYYIKTNKMMYLCFNSEMTTTTAQKWLKLNFRNDADSVINPYTGVVCKTVDATNDLLNTMCTTEKQNELMFTPLYKTVYKWLFENKFVGGNKSVVFACHEIPFTVITIDSLKGAVANANYTRNYPNGGKTPSRLGSNLNQLFYDEKKGTYWLSRLFEYFGVKLVIGGHKHTYAISWPIQEYYFYNTYNEVVKYRCNGSGGWSAYTTGSNDIVFDIIVSSDDYSNYSTINQNVTNYINSYIENIVGSNVSSIINNTNVVVRIGYYTKEDATKSSKPFVNSTYTPNSQGHMPMVFNEIELETSDDIKLSWEIKNVTASDNTAYKDVYLSQDYTGDTLTINTTKLPLIDRNSKIFGKPNDGTNYNEKFELPINYYRCVTPFGYTFTGDNTYASEHLPSPVVYFMLQATGYKITSNKELPSKYQYFSQIVPKTDNTLSNGNMSNTANNNQCYPMYAMLKVDTTGTSTAVDLFMMRVKGIVKSEGNKITFKQGTKPPQSKVSYEYITPVDDNVYGSWTATQFSSGTTVSDDGSNVNLNDVILGRVVY